MRILSFQILLDKESRTTEHLRQGADYSCRGSSVYDRVQSCHGITFLVKAKLGIVRVAAFGDALWEGADPKIILDDSWRTSGCNLTAIRKIESILHDGGPTKGEIVTTADNSIVKLGAPSQFRAPHLWGTKLRMTVFRLQCWMEMFVEAHTIGVWLSRSCE